MNLICVIPSTCVIIYFKPIFCPKFSWLSWCICTTNLLFFDIPLLYHYINLRSSITLVFWWCVFIFKYFFINLIYNCFLIILLWIFWNFTILSSILLSIKFTIFLYSINLSIICCFLLEMNIFFFIFLSLKYFEVFFIFILRLL